MPTPLEGIRILDFTRFQAGPTSTVLLSDLGADIIKVEPPGRGDEGRHIFPLQKGQTPPYFVAHDRGKRSITVDYHSAGGREICYRLARDCDVVVENFRPGAAAHLRLGYEDFRRHNERIVYASVSAFGSQGPLAGTAGFDIHGQAMGGIMSIVGDDRASYTGGAAIGDQLAGMTLASAILGGLLTRERQGVGQQVEVSLYGSQLALQAWEFDQYALGGPLPGKAGTGHPHMHRTGMIWGSYPTAEGDIVLGGLGGERWKRFCKVLGIEDTGEESDAASSFLQDKSGHEAEIRARLKERTAEEWVERFRAEDLMVSKVQSYADIRDDEQARANGYIVDLEQPDGSRAPVVGSPFRFTATPVQPQGPPPELGQHTEMVLLEFGYEWEDIARFRDEGII